MSDPTRSERGVQAIASAFADTRQHGRCALITYLMLGYPSARDSLALAPALQAGGADIVELGVPFSDPVADGPTIQHAGQIALENGVTPKSCFDLVSGIRDAGVTVPLVLMGYYNPIHSYGLAAYEGACVAAGVDGLIVPDLPPEEAGPLGEACGERGLALVFLVAPTTGERRVAAIAAASTGFLYVVSRLGITGTGMSPGEDLARRLQVVGRHATTPIAVGFDISRPEQAWELAGLADGVVVGSAVVQRAQNGPGALKEFVSTLRAALWW